VRTHGKKAGPVAGVLDYGMGNLRSVAKALEAAGARVRVSDSRRALSGADLLVVPGVGAFRGAMQALGRKNLDDFIGAWVAADKPYLGICLGLQLLFERSEEAPGARGLGILEGSVRKFRPGPSLKVPHMGWNRVLWRRGGAEADHFYFVHSYYPEPKDASVVMAETPYGRTFCSAVGQGRLVATQFHPEKSGDNGLRLLRGIFASLL
jgi:imidazole glycerol-phosphate synthase subunit HisH